MLGPIDYVVVGFEGNTFDGRILKELQKAVDDGTIRVIDLLFIMKDENGDVLEGEFEDQSKDVQETLNNLRYDVNEGLPLLTDDDVLKIGTEMPLNTAAGVLVIEHVWAKGLKKALLDAGGFLIADGRVHPEAVEAAVQELEFTSAPK